MIFLTEIKKYSYALVWLLIEKNWIDYDDYYNNYNNKRSLTFNKIYQPVNYWSLKGSRIL